MMTEDQILKDPETSDWLRAALRAALACDPVRVANDALCLSTVLQERVARQSELEQLIGATPRSTKPAAKAAR